LDISRGVLGDEAGREIPELRERKAHAGR